MSNFRLMLLSTAAAGLVAAAVSPAFAGEVEKSVTMGGRVNRAIVVTDNGEATTVSQIDPTSVSGSRFGVNGTAKSESMTIGAHFELGLQANPSTGSQTQGAASSLNIRHSYVSIANDMGTLKIGHTWSADALTLSNALHGTGNAGFTDGFVNSGEELRVTGTAGNGTGSSGITVGGVGAIHGAGRQSTVVYTTPNMSGFSANLGYGQEQHGAAQVTYGGDFDGTKVQAQGSWGSRGGTIKSEASASLAVALAGGLNGSVAYSKQNRVTNATVRDPDFWSLQVGYTMGANAISLWGSQQDDAAANGDDARTIGVTVEHQLSDYGTSIYGGVSNLDYDTTLTKYDDLTSGWVGIRVNF